MRSPSSFRRYLPITSLPWFALTAALVAQDAPSRVEFDVVSIKHVDELRSGGGMRTLPDGTLIMTNQPLWSLINAASPVPVAPRDVVGFPEWMINERYDLTAKPPGGMTREELRAKLPAMWRAMFAERMKLVAHVEQRARDMYSLVVARSDGRLGPNLKPSTLDCTPGHAPQTTPSAATKPEEMLSRCGMMMRRGTIMSGGIRLDALVRSLGGLAGGEVDNQTGLDGFYSVRLTYSPPRSLDANNPLDDAPDIFTAVQEQLGLKLVHGKKMMPVLVIDHIERPSEN